VARERAVSTAGTSSLKLFTGADNSGGGGGRSGSLTSLPDCWAG